MCGGQQSKNCCDAWRSKFSIFCSYKCSQKYFFSFNFIACTFFVETRNGFLVHKQHLREFHGGLILRPSSLCEQLSHWPGIEKNRKFWHNCIVQIKCIRLLTLLSNFLTQNFNLKILVALTVSTKTVITKTFDLLSLQVSSCFDYWNGKHNAQICPEFTVQTAAVIEYPNYIDRELKVVRNNSAVSG